MSIFSKHTSFQHQGWRHVTLEGMQLARQFLDDDGNYTYGLRKLASKSGDALEKELVEPVHGSVVNFAVISAPTVQGDILKHGAFRSDLDFYVLVGMSKEQVAELEKRLSSLDVVPFLCFTTEVTGID